MSRHLRAKTPRFYSAPSPGERAVTGTHWGAAFEKQVEKLRIVPASDLLYPSTPFRKVWRPCDSFREVSRGGPLRPAGAHQCVRPATSDNAPG